MIAIDDACDYIILKLCEGGESLNHLKLQKLLYYAQAWHLAFNGGKPLFDGRFQAWVHGPVNRHIYDRFAGSKTLYSDVLESDMRTEFDLGKLNNEACEHIDGVLEVYAKFSGTQLEDLTHREEPWIRAREGFRASQRCEREIDEQIMAHYYAQQIK